MKTSVPLREGEQAQANRVFALLFLATTPVLAWVAWMGMHGSFNSDLCTATGRVVVVTGSWQLALGLGALIATGSVLMWRSASARWGGIYNAIASMVLAALFMHFGGGTGEAHFPFFVFTSFLLYYHDWRPIAVACIAIAFHHLAFFFLQGLGVPLILFSCTTEGTLFTHLLAAAVQGGVLCYMALRMAQMNVARRRVELAVQESEETFRKLFEDASNAILLIDSTGVFVECNQAALDLLKMERKAFLFQPPSRISPEFQRCGRRSDEVAAEMIALAYSKGVHRFDWTHIDAGGGEFIVEVSLMPVVIKGQAMLHATWRDITERKKMEQALEERKEHLEELVEQRTLELSQALNVAKLADQAKSDFLANMSHELRTPLSAVIGMAGLARGVCTDPKQRDYLDKISISGNHLSRIINDLLDLSKITAGYLAFENISFSLRGLLARCSSVMASRIAESGLQLVETIDPVVPDVLRGDPSRIEQVILNLVGNAIKFTPTGRIEVRVGLLAHEADRVCLTVAVEDSGIGMGAEALERLFKPFSQANAAVSRQYGGTGLGLAISKRLVNMMGGDISVTSCEGSGSTFSAQLWLDLGDPGELLAAIEGARCSAQVRYENVRVLVVDDQPFNREIAEGLLARVGIVVHLANNGQEALDIVSSGRDVFDLVLMDVQMPVMDGITATRAIRNVGGFSALPIVAMTAQTMAHEIERSTAAGMNDHIGKPFDEAGFYRVLAKWISADKQHLQSTTTVTSTPVTSLPLLRGVDTDAGLVLLLGNEERYRYWLGDFVVDAPAALEQIHNALSAGQPELGSMAAHGLKGRTGMLGMSGLYRLAWRLELAIENAEPSDQLLLDLEQGVFAMCAEIRSGLGLAESTEASAELLESIAESLPPGLPPACVTRLLASLRAGDSDSDKLLSVCLSELENTAWVPHLRQSLTHIQNFDYAAASRILGNESA